MKSTVAYQGNTKIGKGEWLTPPELIKALGRFDLDPCAPVNSPWPIADVHLTIKDDGLKCYWEGRVWLNPPYDNCDAWFNKLADHGNGIGLCFNRTETNWFESVIWKRANAVLFIKSRIKFYHIDGTVGKSGPGAGSVLVSYGLYNTHILEKVSINKIPGQFLRLR